MFQKIFRIAQQHKIVGVIIIILVAVAGYYGYRAFSNNSEQVRYVSAAVERGNLIISVSGSGQVSASQQVDIKAKTAGDVIYVAVKNGQAVKAGTLLAQFDTTDAQKAVRDAEISLETARLSLEKLENPLQSGENQLKKIYDDGLNEAAKTYADLSPILESLDDILFDTTLTDNLRTLNKEANIEYYASIVKYDDPNLALIPSQLKYSYEDAKKFYNQAFAEYKTINRDAAGDSIENVIKDTYNLAKKLSDIIKTATDIIQFFKDKSIQENWVFSQMATVDEHLTSLRQYTATVNSHLSNLFNAIQGITGGQIDLKSQRLTVEQKINALAEAQENLANCFIYAPFEGIVAELKINRGDSVSAGTAVATLITKQFIAEISLNEVDAAKVKSGQKATLTFDALPDLSLTGEVIEVDVLGTVSQGVVTYNVKIAFDRQDERVKPGMSVSAAIITDTKQDALMVPNSAIKDDGEQYVLVLENGVPRRQIVETGLSNDTMTEIINGLQEGEKVVTQAITANTANTTRSTTTRTSSAGGTGGFMMIGR